MSRMAAMSLASHLGLGTMAPAPPSHCGACVEPEIVEQNGDKVGILLDERAEADVP